MASNLAVTEVALHFRFKRVPPIDISAAPAPHSLNLAGIFGPLVGGFREKASREPRTFVVMALRAVFLDAGGTLMWERVPRERLYADAARRRGLDVSDSRMASSMFRVHEELTRTPAAGFRYTERWFEAFIERIFCADLDLQRDELPALQAELFDLFGDPGTFEADPEAPELCAEIRRLGLGQGIVSNWSEPLPHLLDGLGLSQRVDFVLVSAIEGLEKPDPRLFERALERAGVEPHEAVHLGDHPERDYDAARSAGLEAVLLDRNGSEPSGTDRVQSLGEFAQWIRRRVS